MHVACFKFIASVPAHTAISWTLNSVCHAVIMRLRRLYRNFTNSVGLVVQPIARNLSWDWSLAIKVNCTLKYWQMYPSVLQLFFVVERVFCSFVSAPLSKCNHTIDIVNVIIPLTHSVSVLKKHVVRESWSSDKTYYFNAIAQWCSNNDVSDAKTIHIKISKLVTPKRFTDRDAILLPSWKPYINDSVMYCSHVFKMIALL